MERISSVLDEFGKPFVHANGKPRPELMEAFLANGRPRKVRATFDAARDSDETRNHWANADSLDPDNANSKPVRHKLIRNSRYENGSNGYYSGILNTHTNMVVGTGPKLRMLTGSNGFNRLIESAFATWCQQVQFRRKLWCAAHARYQDGESFIVLQTNPAFAGGVSLDLMPIEAEQCQTPYVPYGQAGYIDGIKFDEFGNIQWYDVLRYHPGSQWQAGIYSDPIRVSPFNMLHWFKLDRPGTHRGIPASTSTLNLGAQARRWRESVQAGAESAADLNILVKTSAQPDTADPMAPFSTLDIQKRMMTALPMGWDAYQMKAEYPTASHESFNRQLISEQARPISMPYNAAACDSSTYSFASGKLDMLCYRSELDVERADCNDLILDHIFSQWFREWRLVNDGTELPASDKGPAHQWDWPAHPVIDATAEASALDTRLQNGTETLSEAYSNQGRDYEDELVTMAVDWFGKNDDASIEMARKINLLRNLPAHVAPIVAPMLGFETAQPEPQTAGAPQ